MLQPDAFCEHTMQQNATAARTLPRTPLGEVTALPRTLAGFRPVESHSGARGNIIAGPYPPILYVLRSRRQGVEREETWGRCPLTI